MKKFAASYVCTLVGPPLKNGIVTVDDDGTIIGVTDTGGKLYESERMEFYSGILAPGFVNAHCHLELSHLLGRISEKKGLPAFIGEINRLRNVPEAEMVQAARLADREMFRLGISAVGDISNTTLTLPVKRKSPIRYFTFAETFGFHPSRADRAFALARDVFESFRDEKLPVSVTPHAPYSVSDELFEKIRNFAEETRLPLALHNQECAGENQFYQTGDGPILDHLQHNLGLDTAHWKPAGKNSLETVLPKLPAANRLLLVHNTFTGQHDLERLKALRPGHNTWLVLCPQANLYIEDRLPPVGLFRQAQLPICIGTDSLASNHRLSVLSELVTLQLHFPEIGIEELLTWACRNGAQALGIDDRFGTLEEGKRPGLLLLSGVDLKNRKLTPESRVKRLA